MDDGVMGQKVDTVSEFIYALLLCWPWRLYCLYLSKLDWLSLLLLLGLYGTGRIAYSIWWKPKSLERKLKKQGIKGTPYKLLVGDMKNCIRMITDAWSKPINLTHQIVQRVDPFTLNIVQKYGKISMFWNGKTPRLIISDPELMKEVLFNKQGHIQKPPVSPLILILARGLTVLDGEKWALHRRLINPAFHLEKLKGMIPVFAISCKEMIEQWKKMVNHQEACEVDVWPELQKTAKDIISRAAFGSNYEEGKKIFQLQQELVVLTVEAMRTLYIPGFSSENASSTKSNGLTIEEIIEECKVFYLAGQETTSALLTWTMIVLAMHPDWQEKAREEVLQICGKKEPDFEALTHLKIVTMILNEILRLYPPVIALYQHTHKETKIGDITIPAGVDLTLPTLLIHHDPDFWGDDAEEFRPDRFSEGVSKASKDHFAFFPFSWGPRTCIGQNFALLEAKTVLAMILQHFSLELSPSYIHAPCTVMTMQPQHGAQVFIRQL
ncbi:hypothetical protein GH714_038409 [Hevea brasiliensis]|uniref:Cytochrome P450 n=1 Tax=Hevea brasiliensis TaxID=3981 RepID=A0A6A6KGE7_HEVBR|nr:hypothetical protein GH714_038409 [Hevea brasiliensis]